MTNKRVVEMVERSIKWAARCEKELGTGKDTYSGERV